MAISGNVLTYNAESVETDISAWLSGNNSPTISQDTTHALDGTHAVKLVPTSVASGSQSLWSTPRVTVTAAKTYLSYASIWTAAANLTGAMDLDWYSSGGTYISSSTGPTITLTANAWTQIWVVGLAPATTASCVVIPGWNATSTAQTAWMDEFFIGLNPLGPNPRPNIAGSQMAVKRASTW